MDPDAFDALINCIAEGDFDTCEDVPSGDTDGFLINPIAGSGVNMGGPARYYCVQQKPPVFLSTTNVAVSVLFKVVSTRPNT